MKKEPIDNDVTQESVSRCRSKAIRAGARARVDEALSVATKHGLPTSRILVVGPQHGYEPQRYEERGKDVVSVDVVKSFVEDCRKLGLSCVHSPIERFEPISVDGVHASHCLEHTYDIREALSVIKACAKSWIYASIPIIPEGKRPGKGDLSVFRNKKKILELFAPWVPIEVIKKTKLTYTAMFVPTENILGRGNE